MKDPVTLYKDGKEKLIASVDVAGWLEYGWSDKKLDHELVAETSIDPLPSPEPAEPVEVKNVKRK